ncbi:MAG: hypothetical protein A2W91_04030 [Bacteroidetes bacterium GWF2_38_335]|nr:MAG: hypothetical protein A2W91_04030 [Bacteroidetes bacterium GWF2_38_335]OFY79119.1 MAG: hypothetical protein A2281_03365 [Bacteroidetes bacterium RIFOXYA12_FULL_38_20]HBS88794.1 aspartate kinase [Bacteroidales bacterium]
MITISQAVETTVLKKPFLAEAVSEGIINLSALARQIQPDVEKMLHKEVNFQAIVVALNRMAPVFEISFSRKLEKMSKDIGEIVLRSNLADFTFLNSAALVKKQMKLWGKVSKRDDVFYTVSRGVFETTFVVSNSLSDILLNIFEEETLISHLENLSSVTIKLPPDNGKQPGLYYSLLKKIAWNGVSIIEVVSTTNEFSIIIDEKNVGAVFQALTT